MTEQETPEDLTKEQWEYIEAYKAAVLEIFEQVKEETGYEGDLVVKIQDPEEDE